MLLKYPSLQPLKKNLEKLSKQTDTIQDIKKIADDLFEAEIFDDPSLLEEKYNEMKDTLIKQVPIWQDRIERELSNIRVVRLFDNTTLNPEKLSKGAKSFFNDNIWNLMKDIEKEDLNDGCRCISLQAWTPASMITMRAVESVLRTYYQNITKKDSKGKL